MQPFFSELYQRGNLEEYISKMQAFPDGNTNCLRHIVKFLIPDSIGGRATLEDIHNHSVDFEKLDRPENHTRIRLHTTVARIEHLGKPENADYVQVTYLKDAKLWKLRARAVVMAVGGWVNRRVVRDLPEEKHAAFEQFLHSSTLVVNVAVTNWRFLYKLGLTGGRWFDGLGYFCNLRQQMVIGNYPPKLHPDAPTILTLYVPFYELGKPAKEQVTQGRYKLYGTSFREYERQIRETLTRVFGSSGFDAKRDIAGIILNRWGHSIIVPVPGFMYGRNGEPPVREIAWKQFGRISFAHSEFEGGQSFGGAVTHAHRAIEEILEVVKVPT
jgi:spermidine dehydrogenase